MTLKFTDDWAVLGTLDPISVDNGTDSTDWIDMTLHGAAAFILLLGVVDAVSDLALYEAKDSSGTSSQALTGWSITQLTKTDDAKQAIINLDARALSQGFTHVQALYTGGNGTTGNLVSIVALGGHGRYKPASDNDLASVAQIVK